LNFSYSSKVQELQQKLNAFMEEYIYPNESWYEPQLNEQTHRWSIPTVMEELKLKAKEAGLWNLFLPESEETGISQPIIRVPLDTLVSKWNGCFRCLAMTMPGMVMPKLHTTMSGFLLKILFGVKERDLPLHRAGSGQSGSIIACV
jgi:alkylation response protein AidB-like acyl-CoA dehydrogenase